MKTADLYPDARYRPDCFSAFDPEVRFPRFHREPGDEYIGNVRRIQGGPQDGLWQWSVTVSLPGPFYASPRSGTEQGRGAAARRTIDVYRRYLSTRPEKDPRDA